MTADEREAVRGTLRRRGILAAIGLAIVGNMAERTARPVAATTSDTNFIATGNVGGGSSYAALGSGRNGVLVGINYDEGVSATGRFEGVYGFSNSGHGVVGETVSGVAVRGVIGLASPVTAPNTIAVQAINQSTGTGTIGVLGQAPSSIGGSFAGGIAPLRLVPGTQSARMLNGAGHQAGELYLTSDARLYFFDGTNWREVLLAAPGSAVPPAAPARAVVQANPSATPVQPAPAPRP